MGNISCPELFVVKQAEYCTFAAHFQHLVLASWKNYGSHLFILNMILVIFRITCPPLPRSPDVFIFLRVPLFPCFNFFSSKIELSNCHGFLLILLGTDKLSVVRNNYLYK